MAEPDSTQHAPPQQAPPQPSPQVEAPANDAGASAEATQTAEEIGWIEAEQAYVLPLGAGVKLASSVLGDSDRKTDIALDKIPRLPGLTVTAAEFRRTSTSQMVTFKGQTAIPLTEAKDFTLKFSKTGRPAGFSVRTKSTLDWLGKPSLSLSWSPEAGLGAEAKVEAAKFVPRALRNVATAQGDLTLGIADGKLSGAIDTTITTRDLLKTQIKGSFAPEGLSAAVNMEANTQWLGEVKGEGSINAAGEIAAKLEKQAGELPTPVPGLTFTGGTMSIALNGDGTISGGFQELGLDYAGLAQGAATFTVENGKLSGSADLSLVIPGLNAATGTIAMRDGKLSGGFSLGKDSFPEGLPLKNGTINGTISETGALGFSGSVGISLGPAGTGQLEASYSGEGGFTIGAEVELSVPGLQTASFKISHDGTDITGAGEMAVDPALLSGIEGAVKVEYGEGRWSGETTLGYNADNGKLAGQITVRVRQAEDDSLKVSGDGEVTAKIAPRLEGKLQATIKEEGGIDVSGEISVTEPIEMFPEARMEKEILDISSKIPLWAILVAVLRVRAGVRAGIGPGVFRDIKVTGSYTIGEEGEPSFAISGEMYIPAFVEGYVGFGAGLGLSVVLGSLTGGIEAMGTAGIYGAISVIPELAYKDGDYTIEGVATMAAGARLKLSLNAWAEVEALWVTVWDNTWELASVTMPVGPDLGMSANMSYTFGKPDPPTLDFSTSDVDTDKLITDAMPKDGPPKAGVRDAVKNEAKWQGAQRDKGPAADAVPAELQDQANATEKVAPPAGGQAPGGGGAPPGAAGGTGKAADGAPATAPATAPADKQKTEQAEAQAEQAATPDPNAKETVPADQAADTKTPRHGPVSLAMLDEPPVSMPRTKEQQKQDVRAAADLVRLIARSGETTDTLDNYFPRIKARFRLTKIEFMKSGSRVVLALKINKDEIVELEEEIQRISGPGAIDPSKATKVTYTVANRDYASKSRAVTQSGMGVKMVADPLTPLHAQGSGPKTGALKEVFGLLETQGETGTHGYIKGHLLNDNLGGPGESKNLFPITQTANTRHSAQIEELAKTLVNDNHYWVRYTVEMKETEVQQYTDPAGTDRILINSQIVAELDVLKTNGQVRRVTKVTIPSRFNTLRGDVDLHGKTRKELEALAKGPEPMAAKATAELELRDRSAREFLEDDANKVQTDQTPEQAALQTQLEAQNAPADVQHDPVDQADVLLSSARGAGSELKLTGAAVTALTALKDAKTLSGYPVSGGTSLTKRMESVSGLGGTTASKVVDAAGIAITAHNASTEANRDIAPSVGGAVSALRAVNNVTSAADINRVVAQLRAEKAAFDAYLAQRAGMELGNDTTATVLRRLIDGFAEASQADRVKVAEDFGAYVRSRDDLTLVGIKADLKTARAAGDSPMGASLNNAL